MSKNISKDIQKNLDYIKELLNNCDDLVVREIEVGEILSVKMAIVYIDGLIDKSFVSEYA